MTLTTIEAPGPSDVRVSDSGRSLSAIYPSLKEKRVVVTGGASGIGEGLVEAFVRQGARVAFLDVLDAEAEALARRLGETGPPPLFYPCDLTELAAVQAAFERIAEDLGPVQVLVNNAANDDRHALAGITPAYWDERLNVNLRHQFFCAQAVAPAMRAAGAGAIINFGSISWHLGLRDLVLYEIAKAGIEGMTHALARELGPDGVRVTCVVPGNVKTPRQMKWYTPEGERQILEAQCLRRRIEPKHVASLVLFLASDDAWMCTGREYWIDAGWS
jgi:NAD(P)-dependent dehydrogenase (short-subunit alcohol dehydrogenase family)